MALSIFLPLTIKLFLNKVHTARQLVLNILYVCKQVHLPLQTVPGLLHGAHIAVIHTARQSNGAAHLHKP